MRFKAIIFYILLSNFAFAQDTVVMSLKDVMQLAQDESLTAFRAKNMYLKSYWDFRAYKAGLLPNVNLNLTPVSYVRSLTKRYDSEQNIDIFREQRSFENSGELSVSQNIGLTGGNVYLSSSLSRIENIASPSFVNYSATPLRIGFVQPIFAYNSYKWEKKLAPMEFEMAKKQFIQDLQKVKIIAIDYYFNLLLEYKRLNIAENNFKNAIKLYDIGKQKYQLLAIRKEQLLNLELDKYNSEIELSRQKQNLDKALMAINSFLNIDSNIVIMPLLPKLYDSLEILPAKALEFARLNNPEFINNNIKNIQADANYEKALRDSRFSANIAASFGLNQQAEILSDAYKSPLNQEVALFSLQIPLLDWGNAKGKRQIAKMNREITNIDTKQKNIDLYEDIMLDVMNFNLQRKIVYSAQRAKEIANESYELTQKSFLNGHADVLQLSSAKVNRQSAEEKYISSIYLFWKYYYKIQQSTLYDFINNETISDNDFFNDLK